MASTIAAVTTSGGGVVTTADASGNLNLLAGTTTVVALTTAGAAVTGTLSATGATTLGSTLVVTAASNSLGVVINGRSSDNLGAMYFYANNGTTNYATITTSASEFRHSAVPAASVQTFYTNASERMRIDSSGNVGIGVSPSYKLDVSGTGRFTSSLSVLTGATTTAGLIVGADATVANTWTIARDNVTTGDLTFIGNTTERMRIDASGNVGIGGTSPGNRLYILKNDNTNYLTDFANSFSSGNGYINRMNFSGSAPNSTASIFTAMVDTGGSRCIIYANGGIHNYQANNVNLSDLREKINFAPACEYLSKICAIPVQTFNYIDQNLEEDDGLTLGVVAQDVQAVAPELVSESDWSPEKDGSKMRLSIYQTDLQYALMKCIQELKAIIDTQATRIAALEAK
jgi:hypothetical protein